MREQVAALLAPLPLAGSTLAVGFSGGRDSVALLDILHSLAPQFGFAVQAIHINHGLNPRAQEWQQFCENFCWRHDIPLTVHALCLTPRAGESVEAEARAGRYAAFARSAASYLALAHHRDDQAETFLLQALRGAGPFGLAAMPFQRALGDKTVLRPFLGIARCDIDAWLQLRQLQWVDDDSNGDPRYRRNALRHVALPALEQVDAEAKQNLARSAAHCGETMALLLDLARLDGDPDALRLSVAALQALSSARARNLLRAWLWLHGWPLPGAARLQNLLEQSLGAREDRQPALAFTQGAVRRFAGTLCWAPAWQAQTTRWRWLGEPRFTIPGWSGEFLIEPFVHGVDPVWLRSVELELRPRRGGEALSVAPRRPRQSLKNLFQQADIPPWERERWPMFWLGEELVLVPEIGIAVARQVEGGVRVRWFPAHGVTKE